MTGPTWRSLTFSLLLLSGGLVLTGCDAAETSTGPTSADEADEVATETRATSVAAAGPWSDLAQVRAATARYQDVEAATADGYQQFSLHVPNMGIHYLNDSAVGMDGASALDRALDPKAPEILVYVDDAPQSSQRRLVAAEYAIPKQEDEETPPSQAVDLFVDAGADDWHVHPSSHELPLSDEWTMHGECHYEGGIAVFLAEKPDGELVLWTPPTGSFGSWSGTVEPEQCPETMGDQPLPDLLIVHGKWWTLHTWVWAPNPEGVFHPTNPRISG